MVAPWVTRSALCPSATLSVWGDLPLNEPENVARALLLPVLRPGLNGKSFFVAGGQIVEVEDKLQECQPIWLGVELSGLMSEGQRRTVPGWEATVAFLRNNFGMVGPKRGRLGLQRARTGI